MTDDLTGVWDGTYIQPSVGMVTFLATLIETGGSLGGSVTEPCMTAWSRSTTSRPPTRSAR